MNTHKSLLLFSSLLILIPGGCSSGDMAAWVVPIEVRLLQGAYDPGDDTSEINLTGLAGEVLSAQVAVKGGRDIRKLTGNLSDLTGQGGGGVISADNARVRYGGFVPVVETLAMTVDPLLETESVNVPANTAQSVWLTLNVPRETPAGTFSGEFLVTGSPGLKKSFPVTVEVLPKKLPEPHDWKFYLNIWQDPTPVASAHGVEVWSEEHWAILERYAANFYAHGIKAITTHVSHDPWHSVRGYTTDTMVEWRHPGQLKPGGAKKLSWDFTVFDRYVELMMAAGISDRIDCYSPVMGPGGTTQADIRYLDTESNTYRLAELRVGEPLWREAWSAFLPALRAHLKEKDWYERARLGMDEKPEKIMRIIFDLVIDTVPDFRIASAGGYPGDKRKWADEVVLIIEEVTDPRNWAEHAPLYQWAKASPSRSITFYTCCWPLHPNTFLFSQLRESRLLPWIARKYDLDGYLRWAVHMYPEDVWNKPMFTWPSGDMFLVYPGDGGPLDSMRWELMRQGIQDYEAFEIAKEMAVKAKRKDLLSALDRALATGTIIESCSWVPYIEEAREVVNDVIRELGE